MEKEAADATGLHRNEKMPPRQRTVSRFVPVRCSRKLALDRCFFFSTPPRPCFSSFSSFDIALLF